MAVVLAANILSGFAFPLATLGAADVEPFQPLEAMPVKGFADGERLIRVITFVKKFVVVTVIVTKLVDVPSSAVGAGWTIIVDAAVARDAELGGVLSFSQ